MSLSLSQDPDMAKHRYPQTLDTIAHAKADRDDELRRLHAIDALALIVEEHGAETTHRWLRNLAAQRGQGLPCDRSVS